MVNTLDKLGLLLSIVIPINQALERSLLIEKAAMIACRGLRKLLMAPMLQILDVLQLRITL